MKKLILICVVLFIAVSGFSQKGMKSLLNGKNLKGWDTYVGPKEKGGVPIGLNVDPLKIFTVVKLDDANVLRISGEVNASIATQKEYENYHIRMVFKWGDKVYKQLNSGLLYHSYGDFGAGLGVWMSSHELQLCTGKMGDSYCMGKSYFEILVIKSADGKTYTYSPTGEKTTFGVGQTAPIAAKSSDAEKPFGEWNTIDLYCFGGTSFHVVNGKINMVNYNSGKIENGVVSPLTKGKIQLQSEGGELFVKTLEIEPIQEIPAELLN
ncbi:MAG TPA: DUF1080 domain-containing protein [Prolixibacteraceae bacterium]|nr:DUF1080 domain-containing protein [Prolixibacteraceae bacterium]